MGVLHLVSPIFLPHTTYLFIFKYFESKNLLLLILQINGLNSTRLCTDLPPSQPALSRAHSFSVSKAARQRADTEAPQTLRPNARAIGTKVIPETPIMPSRKESFAKQTTNLGNSETGLDRIKPLSASNTARPTTQHLAAGATLPRTTQHRPALSVNVIFMYFFCSNTNF